MSVANRKTYVINHSINGAGSTTWSENITTDFVVDEVVLRAIHYYGATNDTNVYVLTSSLFPNNTYNVNGSTLTGAMCSFSYGDLNSPQCYFRLGTEVRGNYTFTIYNGAALAGNQANNSVCFTLEFVKYA